MSTVWWLWLSSSSNWRRLYPTASPGIGPPYFRGLPRCWELYKIWCFEGSWPGRFPHWGLWAGPGTRDGQQYRIGEWRSFSGYGAPVWEAECKICGGSWAPQSFIWSYWCILESWGTAAACGSSSSARTPWKWLLFGQRPGSGELRTGQALKTK